MLYNDTSTNNDTNIIMNMNSDIDNDIIININLDIDINMRVDANVEIDSGRNQYHHGYKYAYEH